MNKGTLIIGIGTGRCGTLSLAALLNRQKNVAVSHELRPLLSWEGESSEVVFKRFERISSFARSEFYGDVASFNVNYVSLLIERYDRVRVICLRRQIQDVVRSFVQKLTTWNLADKRPVNHWIADRQFVTSTEFDCCFPKYIDLPLREAIERYCLEYQQHVDLLTRCYPDQIRTVNMETFFSSREKIQSIFDWLGLKENGRDYTTIHEKNK